MDTAGDGDGSRSDPGSVAGANAAGADAIALANSNGATGDVIDASTAVQGTANTLILDPNQVLVSFNRSNSIDLSSFGLAGGAPANVLLTGIVVDSVVDNPFAGLAPTLTTTPAPTIPSSWPTTSTWRASTWATAPRATRCRAAISQAP